MSGGHFDYQQYRIREIADSIDEYINGREVDEDSLQQMEYEYNRGWIDDDDTWKYIKENHHTIPNNYDFSPETIAEFKKAYEILRVAEIYAQRIDWLLSGDDDEKSFHQRLKEDLEELKQ